METTAGNIRKTLGIKGVRGDQVIWAIVFVLLCVSLMIVFSSTTALAYKTRGGDTTFFLFKQVAMAGMSVACMAVCGRIPTQFYGKISRLAYLLSVALLAYTLLKGARINEAARWISVAGVTFQTSDLAKTALMVYLAGRLAANKVADLREGFIPAVAPVAVTCALILPSNLSTALLVFGMSAALLFVGGARVKHLLALGGLGAAAVGLVVAVMLAMPDSGRAVTWKNRVEAFVDPGQGDNYQAQQARIAIATGKAFGKGVGKSTQSDVLPHPYSDFVFAVLVEEYGAVASVGVLLLYLILLFRCFGLVGRCKSKFPALLAAGMGMSIVLQAFAHVGVCVGLLPVTGQTLPLVSMGGSSMLITGAQIGIIMSVAREVERNKARADLLDGLELKDIDDAAIDDAAQ